LNKDEDSEKDMIREMCMLEREKKRGREREVRSKLGTATRIFFLQRGMERDMGEVGLG
jgi:hypothetical protein